MSRSCLTILLATVLGCSAETRNADRAWMADATVDTAGSPFVPASVDHVILAVNDLKSGIDEFERLTGVRAQFGGAHPGRGTQNALVSLGGAVYLEIFAPNPADSAGAEMAALLAPYTTLTPYGWAIRSEDLDVLADSLDARSVRVGSIRPGSRLRPDGARLEWRTLSLNDSAHQLAPFFIQWGAFRAHPATTTPMGCTLGELRFEDPAPDELRDTFSRLGIVASISSGPQPMMRLRLDCPTGAVHFPSPQK